MFSMVSTLPAQAFPVDQDPDGFGLVGGTVWNVDDECGVEVEFAATFLPVLMLPYRPERRRFEARRVSSDVNLMCNNIAGNGKGSQI
jgi:hypothetical protein